MLKILGRLAVIAALLTLTDCGVHGPVGNDTGGIIPWSPEAEHDAREIAQANCGSFNKYAVITSEQPPCRRLHRLFLHLAADARRLPRARPARR